MLPKWRVDYAYSLADILQAPHKGFDEELYCWSLLQEPAVWSDMRVQAGKVVGDVLA